MNASVPRIGLSPQPAEPPHSQVSSISVSRPAISTPAPPKSKHAVRAFALVAGLLVLGGLVLGGLALQESLLAAKPSVAANELAHEQRGIAIVRPATAQSKASASVTTLPPETAKIAFGRPLAAPAAPVTAKAPKPNAACDPPFTIDPATGRKKYKMECLK